MEYKFLHEDDIGLMEDFIDDKNTKYSEKTLINFLDDKNSYGFIAKSENGIVGFAYGYTLIRPDGKMDFYLHAIDIMSKYQGNGYGTNLMKFINASVSKMGCRKMFLITNKNNTCACKCYEKSGGVSKADDDIVYVYQ